ncbi:MAG: motility associated factor glycosyltransferase family protein [Candidatus Omnitrophica bacterium]|nr:motility associated factor glycosyltransferase family protein [Candidatus Omnitrophota bacterium]
MTDGPFFSQNIKALRLLNPNQADEVVAMSAKVSGRLYSVFSLQDEYVDFIWKSPPGDSFSLFQTKDPAGELQGWMDDLDLEKNFPHVILLLGFGLGYEAKRIVKTLPSQGILAIIEPDPYQFLTALHFVDLTILLESRQVHFYVGQEIEESIESIGTELHWGRFLNLPYRIAVSSFLRRTRQDFFKPFTLAWQEALQRELANRRSRVEHSESMVINTIANAEIILDRPGAPKLFNQLEGMPVILAAPGPLLNKSLKAIRDIQDQIVISCMHSAYSILCEHDIRPHLVFATDYYQDHAIPLSKYAPSPETYLIADPRIDPQIIRRFYPRIFLAAWRPGAETIGQPAPVEEIPAPSVRINAVYAWLQSLSGVQADVCGPASAAAASFHILARMGCKPLILAGHDPTSSAADHPFAGSALGDSSPTRDFEDAQHSAFVHGESPATGESPPRQSQFLEHEIARFQQIPVFNTSSGALIHGTIASRIESLFEDLVLRKSDITPHFDRLRQSYTPQADRIDLRRAIQEALIQLQEFIQYAKSALDILPLDPDRSLHKQEQRDLLKQLEKAVSICEKEHQSAMELLDDLLQETHFEFEDSRWQTLLFKDEKEVLNEKLRSHSRILDAFIKQAGLLSFLFEEKLEQLD